MKKKTTAWWGKFHFEENKPLFWEIGPLLLGIERLEHEWLIASDISDDSDKNALQIAVEESPQFAKENLHYKRFVFHHTDKAITLTPILADRAQVSRAETPFYLPPGEHVTIYIGSPAWIRIASEDLHLVLSEIPTMRLSDTWHGPNTREGELCYSSHTLCRTNLDDLLIRNHRVLSPFTIYNHSKEPLHLEKLSLPLPFLSVYVDEEGSLWTEEIIVKHENNFKHSVRQGKGAPHIARNAKLLSGPRFHLKPANLLKLFYSLLTE
jgi:hypothetical protein